MQDASKKPSKKLPKKPSTKLPVLAKAETALAAKPKAQVIDDRINTMWVVSNPPKIGSGVKAAFEQRDILYPGPLKDDEVLFHIEYATVDASNRLWISADFKQNAKMNGLELFLPYAREHETPMVTYNAMMSVIESKNPDYKKDEYYVGTTILAEYIVINPKKHGKLVQFQSMKGIPDSFGLGPLGRSSGLTAWTACMNTQTRRQSMSKTVNLQKGDKVYVSAGSGAIGMMATQIYKHMGADVIASTGSDEKVAFLQKDLGITAFNYKTKDIRTELAKFAPDGLQYYFDNVGGPTLEAAIECMGHYGNIILCGMVSTYGQEKPPIRNLMHVVGRQLSIHGFVAGVQWGDQYGKAAEAIKELLAAGKIRWKEHRFPWNKFPQALDGLLTGSKFGRPILVGTSKPPKTYPKEKKRSSVTQSVIVSGGSVIVVLKDRVVTTPPL